MTTERPFFCPSCGKSFPLINVEYKSGKVKWHCSSCKEITKARNIPELYKLMRQEED